MGLMQAGAGAHGETGDQPDGLRVRVQEHRSEDGAFHAVPAARVPELDGVRGIAVLLVLLQHAMAILRDTPIAAFFGFGWVGVDLFFALSGFLITGVLLRTRSGTSYYRRFYIRRALRIWPLYYAFLVLAFTGIAVFEHALGHGSHAQQGFAPKTAMLRMLTPLPLYFLFLQNLWPASLFSFWDSVSVHATWSLCIEEHFYLTWPALVRKLSPRFLIALLCALLLLFPLGRAVAGVALTRHMPFDSWYQVATRCTPFHLDSIAAGCLLALLFGRLESSRYRTRVAATLFFSGAAITLMTARSANPVLFAFLYSGLAAMFAGLLAWSLFGLLRGLFTNPVLRYFGVISYGLYMIHPPIFLAFWSHALFHSLRVEQHLVVAEYTAAIAALAVSIGLAAASWKFFESRILALKGTLAP